MEMHLDDKTGRDPVSLIGDCRPCDAVFTAEPITEQDGTPSGGGAPLETTCIPEGKIWEEPQFLIGSLPGAERRLGAAEPWDCVFPAAVCFPSCERTMGFKTFSIRRDAVCLWGHGELEWRAEQFNRTPILI